MWWFCDARFNSCLVRPTRVIFFLAAFRITESAKHTLRGGAVWSARRAHNPKVGGSNPPPATMNYQVIDISRWPFSLSESSASGGGPPRNDGPSFFSRYYLHKMLTSIILISILGKCRESFTRSSGNLPSLVLPVHERACERSDAGEGEGARRFGACDRRRDVRSAPMPLRGSRNVGADNGGVEGLGRPDSVMRF